MNIHIKPQGCPFRSPLNTNEVFQEQCTTGAILKRTHPTTKHVQVINCEVVSSGIKNLYGKLFIQGIVSEMFRADPAPWRSPLKGARFSCGCPTSSSAMEEGGRGPLWGPVLANPPPWAGQSCAVGARGRLWFNTQRQL